MTTGPGQAAAARRAPFHAPAREREFRRPTTTASLTRGRQAMDGAFGMRVGKLQASPAPASNGGPAAGQCAAAAEHNRALHRCRGRPASPDRRVFRARRASSRWTARSDKSAGGGDIDGFGRQGDDLALDEGLHHPMDHIARVAGGRYVENLRRHAKCRFLRLRNAESTAGEARRDGRPETEVLSRILAHAGRARSSAATSTHNGQMLLQFDSSVVTAPQRK